jgi:hypothetical protein
MLIFRVPQVYESRALFSARSGDEGFGYEVL